METANIREELHQYIDKGDEKFLRLLYALAKEYNDEDDFEYGFTEEDIKLFDERRAKRLTGQSKKYSWQEAKEIITGKKQME
jgi:hypothetical protein